MAGRVFSGAKYAVYSRSRQDYLSFHKTRAAAQSALRKLPLALQDFSYVVAVKYTPPASVSDWVHRKPVRNPAGGVRAQVRRLPSGQVQIKIPLKRNEDPLKKAQQIAKALGKRIVSVAGAGTKRRTGRRS